MLHLILLGTVLVVFALCLSLLLFQGITGAPPLSSGVVEGADIVALLRQAGVAEDGVIYDLGCGWGALVMALARGFPQGQIRGIEMSPVPYWVARFRTRNVSNVRLHRGSFYRADLRDADAITCYLLTKPMLRLGGFLDEALRPGTPVVSLAFWFRDREVAAVRQDGGLLSQAALYYWPARKPIAPVA
jgi:hypothetical protein